MHKVVYTKSLDNADAVDAQVWEYSGKKEAVDKYQQIIYGLMSKEILSNEFLKSRISINGLKALVKIEDVHHCIAVI